MLTWKKIAEHIDETDYDGATITRELIGRDKKGDNQYMYRGVWRCMMWHIKATKKWKMVGRQLAAMKQTDFFEPLKKAI
jgi:hypothetical protein